MRLIHARQKGRAVTLRAHLDPTRVLPDGSPDPEYVVEHTWMLPGRLTKAEQDDFAVKRGKDTDWLKGVKADFRRMCRERLDELELRDAPGVALPGEGDDL